MYDILTQYIVACTSVFVLRHILNKLDKSKGVPYVLTFRSFPDLLFSTQVSVGDTNIGHHLQWKYEPLFSGPQGLRRLAFIGQF